MEDERIEMQWFRAKEVDEMITSGKIHGRQNDDWIPRLEAIPKTVAIMR